MYCKPENSDDDHQIVEEEVQTRWKEKHIMCIHNIHSHCEIIQSWFALPGNQESSGIVRNNIAAKEFKIHFVVFLAQTMLGFCN